MTNEAALRIAGLAVAYQLARVRLMNAARPETLPQYRAARDEAREAHDALIDTMLDLTETELGLVAVPFEGDERDIDHLLADLRRLYLHIQSGGQVCREDAPRLGKGIAALERAQARYHDLYARA